jgi:hypothetical protein
MVLKVDKGDDENPRDFKSYLKPFQYMCRFDMYVNVGMHIMKVP